MAVLITKFLPPRRASDARASVSLRSPHDWSAVRTTSRSARRRTRAGLTVAGPAHPDKARNLDRSLQPGLPGRVLGSIAAAS
jgi:hypothetical protein